MQIVECRQDVFQIVSDWRREGLSVGLVPTMGALHAGHFSLVEAARRTCDKTVATIFVNPTQFGPQEDFARYPRPLDADLAGLKRLGVDLVFTPAADEMYPPGDTTRVEVGAVAEPLEGQFRPGHFRGVATIVLKLFHVIPASVAFFGQKDYQQTLVVRRMVTDLNIPIRIEVCPIVREPDGLAMSSRNVYLGPDARQQALALSRSLELAARLVREGERSAGIILEKMRGLFAESGVERVDYIALVNPQSLARVDVVDRPTLAAIAAYVDATRLIDNRLLDPGRS